MEITGRSWMAVDGVEIGWIDASRAAGSISAGLPIRKMAGDGAETSTARLSATGHALTCNGRSGERS
jgi:hypothetical protein